MSTLERDPLGNSSHRSAGGDVSVTIVVPAFDEEESLGPLVEAIRPILDGERIAWTILVVDDGSRDATWKRIEELHARDARVVGLRLSRNFGHQNALLAGLAWAPGNAVVTMDADLQHPPELLREMLASWRSGSRVVTTRRIDRSSGVFKRLTSDGFYRLLSRLTDERVYPGMSDFCLLDRVAVREILRIGDRQVFLRGLVQWIGFPSVCLPYDVARRAHGRTKYSFGRMLSFALTGITALSTRPLRFAAAGGCLAAALAAIEMFYVLYMALVKRTTVPGWASILVVNTFFFALLFLYLGILGEYLGRVFEGMKGRPRFIVAESVGVSRGDGAEPAA